MPPLTLMPCRVQLDPLPAQPAAPLDRLGEILPAAAVSVLMVVLVVILLQINATRRQLDDLRQDVRHLTTLAERGVRP